MTIYIINQHVHPDGAPSAIFAEQLADALTKKNQKVVLVGSANSYRPSRRQVPLTPIHLLTIKSSSNRNTYFNILQEYWHYWISIKDYVKSKVTNDDLVIATSSPFVNLFLINTLQKKKIPGIFWLHDYFPSSLKSLGLMPTLLSPLIKKIWDHYLKRWQLVIKVGGNYNHQADNVVTYRLWPTLPKLTNSQHQNKKVIYAGNLGVTHDVEAVIKQAHRLHKQGYEVNFYADGPGLLKLPTFINRGVFHSEMELIKLLNNHSIHLVAGTKNDGTGSFPTKAINALYLQKKVIPCGFTKEMQQELKIFQNNGHLEKNLDLTRDAVISFIRLHCQKLDS